MSENENKPKENRILEVKLIAEFMGNEVEYFKETDEYGINGEPLTCYNYSTYWDHLMPVVEKIENLDLSDLYDDGNFINVNFSIDRGHCYVLVELNYDPPHRITGVSNYSTSKIELVYSQVLKFIYWYDNRLEN
jgi:hypothetical protein